MRVGGAASAAEGSWVELRTSVRSAPAEPAAGSVSGRAASDGSGDAAVPAVPESVYAASAGPGLAPGDPPDTAMDAAAGVAWMAA
jgi:hypothetical protein